MKSRNTLQSTMRQHHFPQKYNSHNQTYKSSIRQLTNKNSLTNENIKQMISLISQGPISMLSEYEDTFSLIGNELSKAESKYSNDKYLEKNISYIKGKVKISSYINKGQQISLYLIKNLFDAINTKLQFYNRNEFINLISGQYAFQKQIPQDIVMHILKQIFNGAFKLKDIIRSLNYMKPQFIGSKKQNKCSSQFQKTQIELHHNDLKIVQILKFVVSKKIYNQQEKHIRAKLKQDFTKDQQQNISQYIKKFGGLLQCQYQRLYDQNNSHVRKLTFKKQQMTKSIRKIKAVFMNQLLCKSTSFNQRFQVLLTINQDSDKKQFQSIFVQLSKQQKNGFILIGCANFYFYCLSKGISCSFQQMQTYATLINSLCQSIIKTSQLKNIKYKIDFIPVINYDQKQINKESSRYLIRIQINSQNK